MGSSDCQTPRAASHGNPKVCLSSLHLLTFSSTGDPISFTSGPRNSGLGLVPNAATTGSLMPALWVPDSSPAGRQRQRSPAPSALATVRTRSGYFRSFSPSERRFSNGCSSLYTNFHPPGNRAGPGWAEGTRGLTGGGRRQRRAADSAERSRTCATSLFTNPAPSQQGPPQVAMLRH